MNKKLYFENSDGRVEMHLGGEGSVRVTALSGLGNPVKKYNTVTFAGKDGQKTISSVVLPRNIIIGGDIVMTDRKVAENVLKVLHNPGTLVLCFGDKMRKIFCSQVDFETGARNRGFMNFVLTLTADGPYFTDIEPTDIPVFKRENLIHGEIVFPSALTRRTTEATVTIFGEVEVEPVIKIYNTGGGSGTGQITVSNITTGQKITVETGTVKNETITVNIPERKIISSERGNITHLISDDTYLNKFNLLPGENFLSAGHRDEGEEICVVCSYYSSYREGIY